MKKIAKMLITVMMAIMIIGTAGFVNADTTTGALVLVAEKNQHPGDTFTVAVNFSNLQTDEKASFGINGKIEYDTEKLEFVSITTNEAEGWDKVNKNTFNEAKMNYWFENEFEESDTIGANSNIFTLTFKVKDNVEGDATIKVNVSEVTHNTNFSGASTTISITKKIEQVDPEEPEDDNNQDQDGQNQEQQDGQQNQEPQQTPQDTQTSNNGNSSTGTTEKSKETTKNILPKTGYNDLLWIALSISVIMVIAMIVLYKRDIIKAKKDKYNL